jgi:hypothetical protein
MNETLLPFGYVLCGGGLVGLLQQPLLLQLVGVNNLSVSGKMRSEVIDI